MNEITYYPYNKTIQDNEIKTLPPSRILKSIRENKDKKTAAAAPGWFAAILNYFCKPISLKEKPTLAHALKVLDAKSNFFTKKQKNYLNELTKFFPQASKILIGYELLEHLSPDSLPKINFTIDGEAFEALDGKQIDHPIFVHATMMKNVPAILGNLPKFFDDNIKFSVSLFESGKRFFHSEPSWKQDPYAAFGLSIDPRNFYRNYPEDIGSPTYNKDPAIATKGGNDLAHVEAYIKMQKILGVIGTYVQELQQRCYQELGYPSAISNTDRLYRLEKMLYESDEEGIQQLNEVKEKTNNSSSSLYIQMLNGHVVYNINVEIDELNFLSPKLSEGLQKEIKELKETFKDFQKQHDALGKAIINPYDMGNKISELVHRYLLYPLYALVPSVKKYLFPYHLHTYRFHQFVRFLGISDNTIMTNKDSYNEYEALSHERSKEIGARPIRINCVVISRSTFNQGFDESFKQLAQSAKEKGLPLLIVDTLPKSIYE